MLCDQVCVDPLSDAANCGECGNVCVDDDLQCNGTEACRAHTDEIDGVKVTTGACVHVDPLCGEQGCDEATGRCADCSEAPCPGNENFCGPVFVCSAVTGLCEEQGERCDDVVGRPFCDAEARACFACVDDAGCDAQNDDELCNGITSCVDHVCVTNLDPCGDDLCSEGRGCHECDDDDLCPGRTRCEPTLGFCVPCLEAADCDDGDFCTGVESCENNVCVASGDPCHGTANPHCDNTLLCSPCQNDGDCDNFVFCDGVERCIVDGNGVNVCVDGADPCDEPDDGVVCNERVAACTQCVSIAQCEPEVDQCDGTTFCNDVGACDASPPPVCPSDLPCRPTGPTVCGCDDDGDCGGGTCDRATGQCVPP
jgi:hypothetical protein